MYWLLAGNGSCSLGPPFDGIQAISLAARIRENRSDGLVDVIRQFPNCKNPCQDKHNRMETPVIKFREGRRRRKRKECAPNINGPEASRHAWSSLPGGKPIITCRIYTRALSHHQLGRLCGRREGVLLLCRHCCCCLQSPSRAFCLESGCLR